MFAYILRAHAAPDEQTYEFFRRFKETPGLLHAYSLEGVDDRDDGVVVAIWENREAAEQYLNTAQLRREVDQSFPAVSRTLYEVSDSK